jgi:Pyruvate/2-oxoacid:ferredoxin oxidoreductase delta subunit
VKLLLLHPEVATRDCADCQMHVYDEQTGERALHAGRPVVRPAGTQPACRTCRGCPKGTPENPKSLSSKNMHAYLHYLECQAVGQFPDDPIVRRNAATIRSACGGEA